MLKVVGKCYYSHKSNISELCAVIGKKSSSAAEHISQFLDSVDLGPFAVVKYDLQKHHISLIASSDWDTANEPTVENSVCYGAFTGDKLSHRVGGYQVYHNKWMFVSEDYDGFDVQKAKARTEQWNAIPGIKALKSKIGGKVFWHNLLRENNIQI